MKKNLIHLLRKVTIWLNHHFDSLSILHFKSNNGKYIYLVILGHHCPDVEKFYKIFPDSKQISESAFDKLYKQGIEIVVVGDKQDVEELENIGIEEATILKVEP